jgi:ABC-type branched-subunit amino acid transport system permease subunit
MEGICLRRGALARARLNHRPRRRGARTAVRAERLQTLELTYALIFALAILGLNMLTGFSGQISLGHGAFVAVGAFTTAIGVRRLGLPYAA